MLLCILGFFALSGDSIALIIWFYSIFIIEIINGEWIMDFIPIDKLNSSIN